LQPECAWAENPGGKDAADTRSLEESIDRLLPKRRPITAESRTETWLLNGQKCYVAYQEPFIDNPESNELFAFSRKALREEMNGDVDKRAQELDKDFTIDYLVEGKVEGKEHHIIEGKEAALKAMKLEGEKMKAHLPERILFSYPYAQLYGDSAAVTYKCTMFGPGEKPWQFYGYFTNIFVKRADGWKQTHRHSRWKLLPTDPAQSKKS